MTTVGKLVVDTQVVFRGRESDDKQKNFYLSLAKELMTAFMIAVTCIKKHRS